MTPIKPCLWFDGDAETAVDLYVSLFSDARRTTTSHYGPDMPMPEGTVLVAEFEIAGQPFMALNGGSEYRFTPAVSFVVSCESQTEVDRYWDGLLAGGGEPNQCGWLTDRFGVSWQIVPTRLLELMSDPDPERARRTVQAMMQMVKLDVGALEAAADGA